MISVIRRVLRNSFEIVKDKSTAIPLAVSVIINFGCWILIYTLLPPKGELLFLHYNIYFGVDLIGEWYYIYLMPLLGLAIIVANFILSAFLHQRDAVIRSLLIFLTMASQGMLAWASYLIIQQNS